jgi:hypothetical protein
MPRSRFERDTSQIKARSVAALPNLHIQFRGDLWTLYQLFGLFSANIELLS